MLFVCAQQRRRRRQPREGRIEVLGGLTSSSSLANGGREPTMVQYRIAAWEGKRGAFFALRRTVRLLKNIYALVCSAARKLQTKIHILGLICKELKQYLEFREVSCFYF